MKELSLKDISKYKDPFSLFSDGAIALAKDDNEINGLTIGWGSIGTLWRKPSCSIYVNEVRYTRHILDNSDGFSVCFFNEKYRENLRYYGSVSGKDENKIENGGLKVNFIDDIPYFEESSLVIICKKMGQSKFDIDKINLDNIVSWYKQDGVHTIYYGEIVKILGKE